MQYIYIYNICKCDSFLQLFWYTFITFLKQKKLFVFLYKWTHKSHFLFYSVNKILMCSMQKFKIYFVKLFFSFKTWTYLFIFLWIKSHYHFHCKNQKRITFSFTHITKLYVLKYWNCIYNIITYISLFLGYKIRWNGRQKVLHSINNNNIIYYIYVDIYKLVVIFIIFFCLLDLI